MEIILIIIGIILSIIFTRWVFSIDTLIKHLKAQTNLLAEIALAQGVDLEHIKKLIA